MKITPAKAMLAALLLAAGTSGLAAKGSDVAKGILVGVAAGAIIAAAASAANADLDADYYDYSWKIDASQNAIAACLHKADKQIDKRGGYGITAEKLTFLKAIGDEKYKVGLRVKAVYPGGKRVHSPECVVKRGWIASFSLN